METTLSAIEPSPKFTFSASHLSLQSITSTLQ